jgi:hypothetical protein
MPVLRRILRAATDQHACTHTPGSQVDYMPQGAQRHSVARTMHQRRHDKQAPHTPHTRHMQPTRASLGAQRSTRRAQASIETHHGTVKTHENRSTSSLEVHPNPNLTSMPSLVCQSGWAHPVSVTTTRLPWLIKTWERCASLLRSATPHTFTRSTQACVRHRKLRSARRGCHHPISAGC